MATSACRASSRGLLRGPAACVALSVLLALGCGEAVAVAAPGTAFRPGARAVPVPAGAVPVPVGASLQAAVDAHPQGTTFVLAAGIHRESVRLAAGDLLLGRPGAVLSGAEQLGGFTAAGSRWWTDVPAGGAIPAVGVCLSGHPLCQDPQDVIVDGTPLRPVGSIDAVRRGTFFHDRDAGRIYLGQDPVGHDVEYSVLDAGVTGSGHDSILGITVQGYATVAQDAAVDLGPVATISNVTVRLNHGRGVQVGDRTILRDSKIDRNGQLGIGGGGTGSQVLRDEIDDNGYAGYDGGWEAGGAKFALSTGLIVKANVVRDNDGPGLWADAFTVRTTFDANTVSGNDVGIFEEIGYGAVIKNNMITGNGTSWHPWLWGAGIQVAASPDVTVTGNTLRDNGNGIVGIQQDRGATPRGPLVVRNLKVTGNTVVDSGTSGLAQDYDSSPDIFHRHNIFDHNVYVGGAFSTHTTIAWDGWLAAGMDAHGRWKAN